MHFRALKKIVAIFSLRLFLSLKGVKKMQKPTIIIKNDLDLSLISNEFIVAMLNLILEEKEQGNGLHQDENLL